MVAHRYSVGVRHRVNSLRCVPGHTRLSDSLVTVTEKVRSRAFLGAASLVALILGLTLPIVRTEALWVLGEDASIVTSVFHLFDAAEYPMAIGIGLFSVVLPLVKWWMAVRGNTHRSARWLVLAKWSMLDVFIVIGVAGMVQFGVLGTAIVGPALIPFVAGLLGTAWLSMPTKQWSTPPMHPWRAAMGVALLALLWFAPLLTLEKHWVLSAELSVHTAVSALISQDAWVPLLIFLATAIVVPLYASLSVFVGPFPGEAACRRWQMVDVFALAMAVLAFKLSLAGDAVPRWGMIVAVLAGLLYGAPSMRGSQPASSTH